MSTERDTVTAKAAADFTTIAEAVIDGPDEFARTHPGTERLTVGVPTLTLVAA